MKKLMTPPPSSSTSRWKYDAFLSFRGQDTRTNFTDHLYTALKRAGIRAFRDDNELERGEELGPELQKAIEESRFSVIIFSRNYASSPWCLDEVVHIIKCKKTLGQRVLPVFYDVEPSIVRKQTGSFGKAFAIHKKRFKKEKDKLERWRAALREAANLKGFDVRNNTNRHESTIIDDIVKEISDQLNPKGFKSFQANYKLNVDVGWNVKRENGQIGAVVLKDERGTSCIPATGFSKAIKHLSNTGKNLLEETYEDIAKTEKYLKKYVKK